MKNKENFNPEKKSTFFGNFHFSYWKLVVRIEEETDDIQNVILFQTVANSHGEFVSESKKKLKNKENLIDADEFSFHKIKIVRIKSPSSDLKKKQKTYKM